MSEYRIGDAVTVLSEGALRTGKIVKVSGGTVRVRFDHPPYATVRKPLTEVGEPRRGQP